MAQALPRERIERFLEDLRYEPPWRAEASRELDFYDGNQLGTATLQRMERLGIPPIIVNMIAPMIRMVTGMEARTRTDPIVLAEHDDDVEGAEALNQELKTAIRLTHFNRAAADAFGKQIKIGIGWLEVAREPDPFKYRYRCREISYKEMWWDWRAREPDLSDARFIVRRRWYDADDVIGHFPRHKRLIRQAIAQRPLWENLNDEAQDLARSWDIETATSLQDEEWRDTERQRLAIYEVWYKLFEDVWVLDLPDGRVVELNRKDRRHLEAVASDILKPRKARTHRVRVAYYLGPHQLEDEPSPYRHRNFPYVPFFGFREERSGAPYGLIRGAKSPQEEVNARRSKMLYNLSSRRVFADEDAVEDHKRTAEEVARPDSYVVLNPNRRRDNGFRVETDAGLNEQQYKLMLEAKQNIQDASGLFQEMMGRSSGAGQSGEAVKSLVEQGQQVLGELIENAHEARRQAAEMLLSMIVEDLEEREDVPVTIERATGEKKRVILNHPEQSEYGRIRTNDVIRLRTRVALDETPSSVTYRQQTLQRMMEITNSLAPELQAALLDIVVGATDLPNRREMVERIRQVTGFGGDAKDADPEEQAAQQQALAQQQAIEQRLVELEMTMKEAKAIGEQAKAEKAAADAAWSQARAQKTATADTEHVQAQTAHLAAKTANEQQESERKGLALSADLIERGTRLEREGSEPPGQRYRP